MNEKDYKEKTDLDFVLEIIEMYGDVQEGVIDQFSTSISKDEKELEETLKILKEEARRRFAPKWGTEGKT